MKNLILYILLVCSFGAVTAREQSMQFKHLDITNGLPSNQVVSLFQDSRGLIWIGTVNGLCSFDGYNTIVYQKVKGDTSSLPDNIVNNIYEDHNGCLWIMGPDIISIFDPHTARFSSDHPLFHHDIGLPHNNYIDLFTDEQNNFWLVHREMGIYCYQPEQDTLLHAACGSELMPYEINDISIDSSGRFWIINRARAVEVFDPDLFRVVKRYDSVLNEIPESENDYNLTLDQNDHAWIFAVQDENGVFSFNPELLEVKHYSSRSEKYRLSHDNIACINIDQQGRVLIGTDHGGLNVIDLQTGDLSVYQYEHGDKNSISQNSVISLLVDKHNIIWVGTYKKGLNYFHPDLFKFRTYTLNPSRENWLSNEDVNTFAEDEKGNLWIGTNGGGLIYFNRKENTFKTYRHDPANANSLSSDVIVDMCIDHQGDLWLGTYLGGLNHFDGSRFTRYQHNPANARSLPGNNVWTVYEDKSHKLWIGTLGDGIAVFDRETQSFNRIEPFEDPLPGANFIMSVTEDPDHNIWFATANGVDLYDKRTGRFIRFIKDDKSPNSISSNSVLDIYSDSRGWIWMATRERLNFYDPATQKFVDLGEEIGIPDNNILTLLEAHDGNMWMATPQGLTNLIIYTDEEGQPSFKTKNYDEKDGLHGIEFNEHAALRTNDGSLIFGGSDGFSIFHPENLNTSMIDPKVLFTGLKVQNKKVEVGQEINERILLTKELNHVENITLRHFEKTFSVSFSAINYLNPEKTNFHYLLDGFNEEWITTTPAGREVTYTNLHPGDYQLRVYVSDLENEMKSEEISLSITILPPFWKTKWAYSIYLVVTLLSIFYAIQLIISRERNRFLIQKERLETARVHEMDLLKLKFFTNISHEFRTPLTLILSPLEQIISTTPDGKNRDQLRLMQRNARRLLNLINQLLDFRRLEVQGLNLEVSEGELVAFCREATESFSDLAASRNIQLQFESNAETLKASLDYDKIEKIVFNLLSNAFKFTPENGKISVSLSFIDGEQGAFRLEVKDTGIGIPKDKREIIFERFVQNTHEGNMVSRGSGIGLSLTREFVQMHEGTIAVESVPGVGSSFEVLIPLQREFKIQRGESKWLDERRGPQPKVEKQEVENMKGEKCRLLLVEDNPDIRFYLKDNLKDIYEIKEAGDGISAWELIPEWNPDLVVSDIMMPGMDGLELCLKIKNDARTSHIPVILLTARTTDQHKYEGLQIGADDYITKPFNFELLALRIRMLIERRQQQRQKFQKNFDIQPSEIEITSLDEKFLNKVKQLTENYMQEPDFSVERLSSEVGISRAHLYNKLLALTGKTPIEYIRIMRIRRAAQLLAKSQLTVMEVAYKVGFNDPRYFTKHFKSEYGITPTQYIKQTSSTDDKA